MATTTLSFVTPTPTTQPRRTIFKHPLHFICKTNPPISSNTGFLTCSPPAKSRFQPILKSSQSEALVIQTHEPTEEHTPQPEKVFAVVVIGSRQYIVFPGRYLTTQRLKGANVDDKILLNKVLVVGTKKGNDTTTYVGEPIVTNAVVHAVVEDVGLNPKVIVYKYKKKKNYRRNIGHRQPNTRIRITGITGYQDYPGVTMDSQNVVTLNEAAKKQAEAEAEAAGKEAELKEAAEAAMKEAALKQSCIC